MINYQQKRLADWSNPKQKANTAHLDYIAHKIQNIIKKDGFTPFKSVAADLQEFVQEIAAENNKKIHLWFDGVEQTVEKNILDELIRPVKKILFSICTESIETPELRSQQGKNEEGEIIFRVQSFGDHLEVHIEDDGEGLESREYRRLDQKSKTDYGSSERFHRKSFL